MNTPNIADSGFHGNVQRCVKSSAVNQMELPFFWTLVWII